MTDNELDPVALARAVAIDTAEDPDAVGRYVTRTPVGDDVTDFRFEANKVGYEGWQWSVTLYHDEELGRWTVDEASLVPTDEALLSPPWIPWKDRLEPSDLSVTDAIGTEPDDPRLVAGVDEETVAEADATTDEDGSPSDPDDVRQAVEDFDLSRRRVMSPVGRSKTAQRWYDGPHGPKSLSTKIADGNPCSTCGFLIPLKGDLGLIFGVCANRWSPDDGRVVSLDHGCGEHSAIEPPEPGSLWVQTKPAYDDMHIDIIAQSRREERGDVELLERLDDLEELASAEETAERDAPSEPDDVAGTTADGAAEAHEERAGVHESQDDGHDDADVTRSESDGRTDPASGEAERPEDRPAAQADPRTEVRTSRTVADGAGEDDEDDEPRADVEG